MSSKCEMCDVVSVDTEEIGGTVMCEGCCGAFNGSELWQEKKKQKRASAVRTVLPPTPTADELLLREKLAFLATLPRASAAAGTVFSPVLPFAVVAAKDPVRRDCSTCRQPMKEVISTSRIAKCRLCDIHTNRCCVMRCYQCNVTECSSCETSKITAARLENDAKLLEEARCNVGCVLCPLCAKFGANKPSYRQRRVAELGFPRVAVLRPELVRQKDNTTCDHPECNDAQITFAVKFTCATCNIAFCGAHAAALSTVDPHPVKVLGKAQGMPLPEFRAEVLRGVGLMPVAKKLNATKGLLCSCQKVFKVEIRSRDVERWCVSCNADVTEMNGWFFTCETAYCRQELCLNCATMFAMSK